MGTKNRPSDTKTVRFLSINCSTILPSSSVIISLFFPLRGFPKDTCPLILAIYAVSFGLLASNSSDTLGRPDVISLDFCAAFGIFAKISTILTFAKSFTKIVVFGSKEYVITSLSSVARVIAGLYVAGM